MKNACMLSPSTLAFVGDAVYGLLVRTKLSEVERPVGELHKKSVAMSMPTRSTRRSVLLKIF